MAVSELYVCDQCSRDVTLVHAEEWQAGTDSEPQEYSGWGMVGGLLNRCWCPTCRAVRPHIFVRLDPPAPHAVVAFAEAQRIGATGKETGPCSRCGQPLSWRLDGEACPDCKGVFRFAGEWENTV